MGADFIGWRGCSLQDEVRPEGFLAKLKLRSYRRVLEEQVPDDQRADVKLQLVVDRGDGPEERTLTYAGIVEELGVFEAGTDECAECPLSGGGNPVGCYRYVGYPVDAVFERTVFEAFTAQLNDSENIGFQLWADLVSQAQPENSSWHLRRGAEYDGGPALAELDTVLTHTWTHQGQTNKVDSAMLLSCLFQPMDRPPLVVAFTLFWTQLLNGLDGSVISSSGTLQEIARVTEMLLATYQRAVDEGWLIIVDG
jgi:hypothetical protein